MASKSKNQKQTMARVFATVLRDIATEIERLSDEDVVDLAEGFLNIHFDIDRTKKGKVAGRHKKPPGAQDGDQTRFFEDLERQLRECNTRDDGIAILNINLANKRELTRFARHLDVGVQKSDTVEILQGKVISTTIGYRIRSAAIRGEK
ncbi:MAG: hypothetical protein H6713_40645 [Myxococcales bacterium]|nr:hypothetical protein [Myxococcales bacterium]